MNDELKSIKKVYGEEMMHLCRDLFPSLLEKEGLLLSILQENLAPTHSFAKDIIDKNLYTEFKNWIYSFINVEIIKEIITRKTPFKLMDEAGYTLYECKTEKDIQKFKKYYAPNEVLCTISSGGRLNRCYVFFAVKKNVDDIKRENFSNPEREDEYGTSVISIQFSRGEVNDLSIKNRYNHTVNNPDATFSNNLEKIIPGLTKSFEKHYKLNINQNTNTESHFLTDELNYFRGNDGKFYRYNIETYGITYCENNIILEGRSIITKYAENPERYILMDQYILDIKEKKIFILVNHNDSFIKSINDVGIITKIDVLKNRKDGTRIINIFYEDDKKVIIKINKNNAIIGYINKYVQTIGNNFLSYNKELSSIWLPNVHTIKSGFLEDNNRIHGISLPMVKYIGEYFLNNNKQLSRISLPNVEIIEGCFLYHNEKLSKISLPKVQTIGNNFLYYNVQLCEISLPAVKSIGDYFLLYNKELYNISLPKVKKIGKSFLSSNKQVVNVFLPVAEKIEDRFLYFNEALSSISLPLVRVIGSSFLALNECLSSVSLPNVEMIGKDFLWFNNALIEISLPHVIMIQDGFLDANHLIDKEKILEEIKMPTHKDDNSKVLKIKR